MSKSIFYHLGYSLCISEENDDYRITKQRKP